MVYKWVGFRYAADATAVGEEIEKIEKANGEVTRSAVVQAARSEDSAMHSLFEWDDAVAGEKYREHQAGQILHALTIVPTSSTETRAFLNIEYGTQPGQKGRYVNTVTALESPDMREVVLGNARRELEAFTQKYKDVQELAGIIGEITKFLNVA